MASRLFNHTRRIDLTRVEWIGHYINGEPVVIPTTADDGYFTATTTAFVCNLTLRCYFEHEGVETWIDQTGIVDYADPGATLSSPMTAELWFGNA